MIKNPPPPFSCRYTSQVPELLNQLGCSLIITTYQAGKLIFLSPKDNDSLVQLPRTFQKPMGVALDNQNEKLALATKDEITIFANSKDLAQHYPKSPNKYDALYMPRLTFHTNALDIHDLSFGKNGKLFAINTLFSCVITLDDSYNFTPIWKPPFISKIASEDRCHLNGMAMQNGQPKYVSAFNQGDSRQSWRAEITTGGILMDVLENSIVATDLPMPHSPRIFDNELYVLLSATGELAKIDLETGKYDVVYNFNNFVRGLAKYGDYVFVGLSKLRKNSSTFAKLDIAKKTNISGIAILHLPTASLVGQIQYLSSVDEIYDIHVLPNAIRPNILGKHTEDYKKGVAISGTTFWSKTIH